MTETRHTAHAAQGRARLRKAFVERPDTVVHLPGGETMTLKRSDKDTMPLFRKLDPRKFDVKTGQLHNRKGKGKDSKESKGGGLPSSIPFSKVLVTALFAHQLFHFLNSTVLRWWRRRSSPPPAPGGQAEGAVVTYNNGTVEVWDEEDLDEEGRVKLAAAKRAQAEMARAMLRNAMPKPTRQSLPQRAAAEHASRQRPVPSAKQRMGGPSKGVKQRVKGKLEKMDDAMKREVKAALMANRMRHQGLLTQGPAPGGATQVPLLTSSASAPKASAP